VISAVVDQAVSPPATAAKPHTKKKKKAVAVATVAADEPPESGPSRSVMLFNNVNFTLVLVESLH
jgi:hypothetical protein